ncbi:P-loop containing nucleoside triphosphate hydrolase protein [Panaeolus papilionaceus]|nr:P-loop containing nucleoside triphosphate hydrolase protein [Panaeolus papilionaceus]
MWDKACYGYVNNVDYVRMKSLTDFAGGTYRQDIISGNLGAWIMSEFKKAYDKLVNVPVEHPYMLYDRTETPCRDMMLKALGDLPMVYRALLTILRPLHFSLSSLAILQQSSAWLGYSLGTVFQSTETFRQPVMSMRKLYEECSQSKQNAVSDISLSIKPNQLVIIVGTNGSGKSTLIRILSCLYDPTSGEVCIDRRASLSYRVRDLHKATAILSQDNLLYTLTLAENIGIRFPERSSNMDLIRQAAEEGGAVDVIKKPEDGYEMRLDPMQESFSVNLYNDKQHPLVKELEGLRKTIDMSGGEKQKLVA